MTNNHSHYNIFLLFLILCFSISCERNYKLELKTIKIPWIENTFNLPQNIKNIDIQTETPENVDADSLQKYLKKYLKTHCNLEYSAKANIEFKIKILPPTIKIIDLPIINTKFKNNLAYLPDENYRIEKKNVFSYIFNCTIMDTDINYLLYQKQFSIDVDESTPNKLFVTLEKYFLPKIQPKQTKWASSHLSNKALKMLSTGESNKAIQEITKNIDNIVNSSNKKKQISLQQLYNLGSLYHNRYTIFNLLNNSLSAQKDKKRAQVIFSALTGKQYD